MTSLFAVVENCLLEPTRVWLMTFLATTIAGVHVEEAKFTAIHIALCHLIKYS